MARRISTRNGIKSEGFGEGMTLIKSFRADADSSIDSGVVFTDEFECYLLVATDLILTNSTLLNFRVGTGSPTVTYDTSSNYLNGSTSYTSGVSNGSSSATGPSWPMHVSYLFFSPARSAVFTSIQARTAYVEQSSSRVSLNVLKWQHRVQAAVTGFQIYPSAGTITSGRFNLYGFCPNGVKNV